MLLLLGAALASPAHDHAPTATPLPTALDVAFTQAAEEFQVPKPILMAIGWEATRWNPDVLSTWGGWTMFDLREGDQDPSLEHAAALLEVDPNLLVTDWRESVRGVAAILADQGRLSNGGTLPPRDDLLAWWDAVRAFSGREEPVHQDLYASYIFETVAGGALGDTRWGTVVIPPHDLDLAGRVSVPPPASADSSLASQYFAACSDNYSDYSRGSSSIDMVVIHTVQGSYSSCYNWFANCSAGASAHYVVRSSDGQITQMVKEADVAWHAGHWDTNLRSVGIEHEGYIDDPGTWYTDAMYTKSAALTADIASRQGVSLDRTHIIAHYEVPGCSSGSGGGASCHTDPGSGWDWDYYMALLNGETSTGAGQIVGVVADQDIYNGTRLVGATVWIEETGDATTVESDGYYRLDDIPFGTYTIHASYPGYAEGTCTKDHQTSQDWCSIALYPETTGGDTGDTGGVDTAVEDTAAEDTASVDTGPGDDEGPGTPQMPGTPVRVDEVGACGCSASPAGAAPLAWLLGLVPLALGRRRR